jgi:hypothetical protein
MQRGLIPVKLAAVVYLILASRDVLVAEVVRFEIAHRESFAKGDSFGDAGEYERIIGRVEYAIDPAAPQNRTIIDRDLAPLDEAGRLRFSADLFILAPKDLSKCRGAALYDVNNRGNKLALHFFNDAPGGNNAQSAGNGYLLRAGWVVVWSGWSGELLPGDARLRLTAPRARGHDGQPITGPVRYEISVDAASTRTSVNRENHGAYRPTEEGVSNAALSWRLRSKDARIPIPREQFRLHVTEAASSDLLPQIDLELPAGVQPGYLYELVYEAQDPLVHGVCFAAVRDLIAALKFGEGEGNPLLVDGQPAVARMHAFGVSQSGRFLREFLYSGFNEDERGRQVFDGMIPHVAGCGLGSFNHRFAQPTAFNTQHELHDWPCDRFPFAYESQHDPLSGRTEGVLDRAVAAGVVPKIMHTQSAAEYWSRGGSLVHTDPAGTRDATLPEDVRIYAFGGTQHVPAEFPPDAAGGQNRTNPADYRPLLRALLAALDAWVKDGIAPPENIYPKIASGGLVSWEQPYTGFPRLPGVRYPEVIHQPFLLDFGATWSEQGIAEFQPPRVTKPYRILVPRSDADGNDVECIAPPEVAVPAATFTGWNLRHREIGAENELVGLNGSFLPFPVTRAAGKYVGDPRLSLEERYPDWEERRKQLNTVCERMVKQGYLLAEDIPGILDRDKDRYRAMMSAQ